MFLRDYTTVMETHFKIQNHWLVPARYVISPNQDARPEGSALSLLVVHGISLPPGEFGGPYIEQLFTNQLDPNAHPYFAEVAYLKVSAHLLIRRDGEVVQFVPFHRRAWHAGVSQWSGQSRCNDFSIGIELEGTDTLPYTQAQYAQLVAIAQLLRKHYGIQEVVGHCHIAPERKTDPGEAFDWHYLREALGDLGWNA